MSLLSALLTQDQVVSPKVIDEAIQRQVISGGDLETNLLELGVILEDTLASYCAAVLALQPASRDEVFNADPEVAARLPTAMAERYHMAALRIENGRILVATCRSVTYEIRAEVEAATGYTAEFRGITSVRLAWALWKFYQVPLAPRLLKLNERLQSMPSGGTSEVTFPLTKTKGSGGRTPSVSERHSTSSALAMLDAALKEDDSIPPAARSTPPSHPPRNSAPRPSSITPETPAAPAIPSAPAMPAVSTTPETLAAPPRSASISSPGVAPVSRFTTAAWGRIPSGDATATVPDPTNTPDESVTALSPHRGTTPWIELPKPPTPPQDPKAPASPEGPAATPTNGDGQPKPFRRSVLHAPTPAIHVEPPPEAFPEPPQPPSTRPLPPASLPPPPTLTPAPVPALTVPTPEEPHTHRPPRPASRPATAPHVVVPPPVNLERGISLAEATRRLEIAVDRDVIVDAMLDHLWRRFEYVAAFVVQGELAHGLSSRGEGASGEALRQVTVPLRSAGVFQLAWEHGTVEIERVALYTPEHAAREALGRMIADEVLVAPVRVGSKVVMLLWVDAGAQPPSALAMRDLGRFVQSCSDAFMRVIAQRKRQSQPSIPVRSSPPTPILAAIVAPQGSPLSERPGAQLPDRDTRLGVLRQALSDAPTPSSSRSDIPAVRPPSSPAVVPVEAPSVVVAPATLATDTLGAPSPVTEASASGDTIPSLGTTESERLVAEVVATGELTDATIATLLGHGERALGVVFKYFPGPHTVVRSEAAHRLPVLEERGPLLRLAVTFRQAAVPRLLAALQDPDEDKRFCALLCLGEVVHPSAIGRIIPKLTDPDYSTRMAAIEVLRNYRRFDEFDQIGRSLRQTMRDVKLSPDQRRSAAYALGELRDTDAIPELVATLTDSDPALSSAAQRALVVLTRQDFGTSPQPWLEWWDRSASRHRIEWLIDALLHSEATLRHDASEELKKLTGQYFGYYFNLPRRERERAHQRYVEWWRTEGAERFAGRDAV